MADIHSVFFHHSQPAISTASRLIPQGGERGGMLGGEQVNAEHPAYKHPAGSYPAAFFSYQGSPRQPPTSRGRRGGYQSAAFSEPAASFGPGSGHPPPRRGGGGFGMTEKGKKKGPCPGPQPPIRGEPPVQPSVGVGPQDAMGPFTLMVCGVRKLGKNPQPVTFSTIVSDQQHFFFPCTIA